MKKDLMNELNWRGLVNQITDEGISEHLDSASRTLYCGFDPTGDSLHIGHLVPILIMKHFENYGHQVLALVGGGTGMIGDPSGRSEERQLNTEDTVVQYTNKIREQLIKYLDENNTKFVNNYDWISRYSAIDFLRDVGKNFNINYLLAKESIATRLDNGLSFTEFSYTILQALDFCTLYKEQNCTIQLGGSDQWGNITSGLELIRKELPNAKAYGITLPLITKSDGTKFGKTAGKAIWLNPEKTSPYEFYQFFLNTNDDDVIRFLKIFTFLPESEIDELAVSLEKEPFKRLAQKKLAEEITTFVHGKEGLEEAIKISNVLFSGDLESLTIDEIESNLQNFTTKELAKDINIVDALIEADLSSSKREAREFINNNAIKYNGKEINSEDFVLSEEIAIGSKYILLKRGKKNYALIKLV